MTPSEILDEIAKVDFSDQILIRDSIIEMIEKAEKEAQQQPLNVEHLTMEERITLFRKGIRELRSEMTDEDWHEMLDIMSGKETMVLDPL